MIDDEMTYCLVNLRNERPDESIAVISVLSASFDVKKITAKNINTG